LAAASAPLSPSIAAAAGIGVIVGVGMAAFSLPLDLPPLILGAIAGVGSFLIILHYG
jgi:hypothetical protein